MKRVLFIFIALLAVFACKRDEIVQVDTPDDPVVTPGGDDEDDADDPDDVDWAKAVAYVFDSSTIPEIRITTTRDEWQRLLSLYDQNPGTQEYIHCDISFSKGSETTTIVDAGLRLKGNTSRRRPEDWGQFHHVHFGVDLHEYNQDAEHTLKGLRKFDLKWFKDDPMYVREVFCYDLFQREGVWTGIRDIYCRLWVNGRYYGVYGLMEHIDKNYLRIREKEFGGHGGNLWKCRCIGSGATLKDEYGSMGVDDNMTDYAYELKTNKTNGYSAAEAQLRDFIRNLNSLSGSAFDTWISSHMDVDLFLKTQAINVAVGMWDDYWNNANNYYLYFSNKDPKDYKVWLIPYDYDNTLGTSLNCGVQSDSGRQDPLKWGHSSYPLATKILQNETWRAKYVSYLKALCGSGGNCSPSVGMQRIRSWHSRISSFVSNDTGEDMSIGDQPAYWGNHHEYRLLESGSNNFFEVKAATVAGIK